MKKKLLAAVNDENQTREFTVEDTGLEFKCAMP